MSYTGRTRAVIRDTLLALWSAEYTAAGARLLVAPGSDAYLWASALAVLLEGLEAQAENIERDILPDQASPEALARHGDVDGVARRLGARAVHVVTLTGPVAGTFPIPTGTQMAFSDGTLYNVDSGSVTFPAGPLPATVDVTAVDAGAAGTRAAGANLTFVATPVGINSTGTVTGAPTTPGTDQESLADWATRIIARRQERPASGNRADWQAWVESYTGSTVARAFVYPLLAPPASFPGAGTPETPGCVTVVAVGPAQGDSTVKRRIVPVDDGGTRTPGAALTRIRDYIEGDRTIAGVATTSGTQLRPVTMLAANAAVEAISETAQNVVLSCAMTEANAFPWTGALTIVSSTATSLTVSGDHTAKEGLRALVLPAAPTVRGTTIAITLGPATFGGVNTVFDQTAPGSECGSPTGLVYPCPPNWETIRADVFAHFDALGPGDTTPASRWPEESVEARATLYRQGLAADVINGVTTAATGVLSCTVTTPAADVTPAAKTVVTLGTLIVTP